MVAKTSKEKEDVSEQVKAGNIQRTKKYKYLGITINEERNLKGHIEEVKQKYKAVRDYKIKESNQGGYKCPIKIF